MEQQTRKNFNRPFGQQRQIQSLTEEKVKEIIMDVLIELDLVPKPRKRKILNV